MSSSHMRMKIHSITIFLLLVVACSTVEAQQTRPAASPTKPVFVFNGVGYFHRWSKNNQHEFTPEKQEDLDKWSDMMTVNAYPDVQDGERLAQTANAVLDNYKRQQAKVLKTDSVPRTADRPAEHFICSGVWPAKFHRGGICPLQAGGWHGMLVCLFTSHLRRESGRRDERLAQCQRSGC